MSHDKPDVIMLRDRLLTAALAEIPFAGWTLKALRAGAEAAGEPPEAIIRAFPRGVPDALAHFSDWADRQMLAALAVHDLQSLKIRERITLGVRTRLEILQPHREAVRGSLGALALPGRTLLAARLIARTADAMWHAAGDTATDFNYYTKRGLLAAVLTATTLYWLNDQSPDQMQSWAFLDRRIANVMQFGKGIARLKKPRPMVQSAR